MKRRHSFFTLIFLGIASMAISGQALKLVPRKYSEVELVFGKKSVIFDLDEALIGSNGSLPGNAPHKYRALFTAEKDEFIYLVANVRSSSPVTNKNAPCGGDSPQSILWIKADKTLKKREVQSEIYESCSYNYYDSKLTVSKTGLLAKYGGSQKLELRYNNREPEKGLRVIKADK